jgi:predicted transcriptional regulator of viral defense system
LEIFMTTKKRRPGRPSGRGLATGELKRVIQRRKRWTPRELADTAGTSLRSANESLRVYTNRGLLRRVGRGAYERIGA